MPSDSGRAKELRTAMRWCLLTLSVLIGGCYAELDWRELASREGGFSVLMPARVREESRPLSGVAGNPVMHLWSTTAASTVFGVGYADLSHPDAQALATMRDGLVRNIRGSVVSERGVKAGPLAGLEFIAQGSISDARATLNARLLMSASGARVYQLAVVGRTGAVTPADMEMFFESFRLRAIER